MISVFSNYIEYFIEPYTSPFMIVYFHNLWRFTDMAFEFDKTFDKLKELLIFSSVFQPSDWNFSFEIMYDTRDYAVGAVLG